MSDEEIAVVDAKLNALVAQRDNAMNQYVMLMGEYAKLKVQLEAALLEGKAREPNPVV